MDLALFDVYFAWFFRFRNFTVIFHTENAIFQFCIINNNLFMKLKAFREASIRDSFVKKVIRIFILLMSINT